MAGDGFRAQQRSALTFFINFFLIHFIFIQLAGAALHSSEETQYSAVGPPVTLGCSYTPPSASVENIDVWWKVSKNGVTETLFASQNDVIMKHTKGFEVDEAWLLRGNASLQLINTTVSDEGVYSCGVIIQPDQYDRTIHLKLTARPQVSMPDLVTVLKGEEKTLRCEITKFYPEQLKVSWKTGGGGAESAARDVCTGIPVPNSDGTFNLSSRITVKGEMVSGERVYECQIEHRAFPETYRKNTTVRVQGPEKPYNTVALIAGTVISSVFFTALTIGGAVILYRHVRPVPHSVSEIIKPDIIYANTPTTLRCIIRGVKANHLNIRWYRSPDKRNRSAEEGQRRNTEKDPLIALESLYGGMQLQSAGEVHTSSVTLKLSIDDNSRQYYCMVECGGKKITKDTMISVKVKPSRLQISCQPQIPRLGKPLVLCCWVEKFYPEDIWLDWLGQGRDVATWFGPFADQEKLYSVWNKVELTVNKVNIGTTCTCRVYHSSFPAPFYKDIQYHISTDGQPPNVAFIQCDPPQPQLGTECTLNLCIKDFCPRPIAVSWYKDEEKISDGVFDSPASLNNNGFYSMWTFLKMTPSKPDYNSVFRCVVEHSAQTEAEERQFSLMKICDLSETQEHLSDESNINDAP
ncbi:uncharacterized protein LOC103021615 [Astyanax mexicanus]|uniref:uncharacterized protein LOC103021615 n=1 Tax=Astyanax mexicanus TaxID=7994 RepID=UPI0020CAA5F5|nr:uncharacterized protein LOC103021615 [Astyanax mexicanus]